MKTTDTHVRARIDARTKALATHALDTMGLSVSDAIRLLMITIAEEHCLPFTVKVPNTATKNAITELESRKGYPVESVDALMIELHAND